MPKRCEVCNLDLQDNYAYEGHILGKKHLRNAHVNSNQSVIERSIFVSHLPHFLTSKELLKFFSQFDEIVKFRFGPNHLILEFKTRNPVEYLLKNPIYYSGVRLNIHPRIIPNNAVTKKTNKTAVPETINDTVDLVYSNIKSIFDGDLTFDEQLTAFLNKVAISHSEIETRYEPTCKKLDNIFRTVFPKSKTYRFGSTVSGLGFQNCDLDIYMDIGVPICHENNGNLGPNVVSSNIVFGEVKRILYGRGALFTKIVPIPRAKTPIIKFTYIPTKISCDISFKNSLAVHNSQLIKFYLSLDPRLRPAMMVLKYWVCNYELKGGNKMSKYALTILFIFYLQQQSVKIVPPIMELKRRCIPEIVEGWQVNFCNVWERDVNESQQNTKSIPELLYGFFDFYANYNFKVNVACCIDGCSYKKDLFKIAEDLPASMDRYKEYLNSKENAMAFPVTKPMCVQDPNELNHNVTGNVCAKYLDIFQQYCAACAEICVKAVENNYKELLPSIFSLIIKTKSKEQTSSFLLYADHLLRVGLPPDFESRTDIADTALFVAENWFDLVLKLIKVFFEKVLKLQIQFNNPEREQKQQKIELESDVHTNDQEKIVMRCSGNHCLWRNRKIKLNILDPSISILEKEIKISEKVFKNLNPNDKPVQVIDFECQIVKKVKSNPHLIFTLSDYDCAPKVFPELALYVQTKMTQTIKKTLAHMQQFKKKDFDLI